jgi:cold shock CspA family protein
MSLSTFPQFRRAELAELREGQTLEFDIEPARNGKTAAANLKLR